MEKQDALATLAALAQETRLDVFRLLVRAGGEGLPAGAIADALDVPAATLSFHLKELRSAGIVACQRDGRERIYRPDFRAMDALLAFLTENCCQGVAGRGARRRR
jgi:DNA-binding transcriptional ArsR family regulator